MSRITIHHIISTSIVTAFVIAAALIWKDVIVEVIDLFFPADRIFYKFIVAIIATIIVVVAIYLTLKTESKAEHIIESLAQMNKKKRKEIIKAAEKKAN